MTFFDSCPLQLTSRNYGRLHIKEAQPKDWYILKNKRFNSLKVVESFFRTFGDRGNISETEGPTVTLAFCPGVHRCKNVKSYKPTADDFLHIPHISPPSVFTAERHQSRMCWQRWGRQAFRDDQLGERVIEMWFQFFIKAGTPVS